MARSRAAKHFEKIATDESHVVESWGRKMHGIPGFEPREQRGFNTYTERRTYGRDQNGELVVRIDKDPSDPVRPATPVRPVAPVRPVDSVDDQRLQPVLPIGAYDPLPISIPRIDARRNRVKNSAWNSNDYRNDQSPRWDYKHEQRASFDRPSLGYGRYDDRLVYAHGPYVKDDRFVSISNRSDHYRNGWHEADELASYDDREQRYDEYGRREWDDEFSSWGRAPHFSGERHSPRSTSGSLTVAPMKRLVKRSRWVIKESGQPVTPFTESIISYVPQYGSVQSLDFDDRHRYAGRYDRPLVSNKDRRYTRYFGNGRNSRRLSDPSLYYIDDCSYFWRNPFYSD